MREVLFIIIRFISYKPPPTLFFYSLRVSKGFTTYITGGMQGYKRIQHHKLVDNIRYMQIFYFGIILHGSQVPVTQPSTLNLEKPPLALLERVMPVP